MAATGNYLDNLKFTTQKSCLEKSLHCTQKCWPVCDSVKGTGEAEGAAVFRLVVISGTGVTGHQTGTGEMTRRTRDCRRGDRKKEQN